MGGRGINLHLGDGGLSHGSVADREARDPLFGERAVEDAVRPELLLEADGAPEHTSKRYVFPKRYLGRKNESGFDFKRNRLTTKATLKRKTLYGVGSLARRTSGREHDKTDTP